MKLLSRVVWSEGMYLAPHHFQVQNRYFEDAIQFASSSLWFEPFGLLECELDSAALQNGTVVVRFARGVFPDGLSFNIPGSDSAPEPRTITTAFSPTRESHLLHLAIPERRSDGRNFAANTPVERSETRYVPETRLLPDELNGQDERPVEVGRKNFRLLLDSGDMRGLSTLPIARIRRDGGGRFIYDPTYVPPMLRISGSPHLLTQLRQLCDLMDEKTRIVASQRGNEALADRYRRDITSFLFLHTVQSSLAVLRHDLLARKGHPEQLYSELARLAGGLSCFALDASPRDLPLYDHMNLGQCFDALFNKIRAWLDLMIPDTVFTLSLREATPGVWAAGFEDSKFLDRARWILEIQSPAGEAAVIHETPSLVKICSHRFIDRLVKQALPGLTLTHLPSPPPEIPTRVEAQYFGITRTGPCWTDISTTRQVGVYVPDRLPNPQMAIHILLER